MSDWWADRPPAEDHDDEPAHPADDAASADPGPPGGGDRPRGAAMPERDPDQGWPPGREASSEIPPESRPPAPPSSSSSGSSGAGWTSSDRLPELPVHPPVPHVPHAPAPPARRHSRNPVDRLTRGLPDPVRIVVDWVVTIVGAIAIVLLVKAFVVNPYRIPSSSMESTLHCAQPASGCEARFSDRVLANRFLYHLRDPRRGEIVVFETPPQAQVKCGAGGTFVKRLVGMPGETIEVRLEGGDGYVFVNGRKLSEPYVEQDRRGAVEEFGPVKVPEDAYFMMGDNRAQSCDSRVWGSVPRENLIGKVFATYWPPNRLSLH